MGEGITFTYNAYPNLTRTIKFLTLLSSYLLTQIRPDRFIRYGWTKWWF